MVQNKKGIRCIASSTEKNLVDEINGKQEQKWGSEKAKEKMEVK